ncbi:hypothetical protein BDZ91DRAFT_778384 [Kalaharituber pfeilii]|nr:hypothetical protein BDZ91DRAFT_778384 [Kalaharituber pfeilii]
MGIAEMERRAIVLHPVVLLTHGLFRRMYPLPRLAKSMALWVLSSSFQDHADRSWEQQLVANAFKGSFYQFDVFAMFIITIHLMRLFNCMDCSIKVPQMQIIQEREFNERKNTLMAHTASAVRKRKRMHTCERIAQTTKVDFEAESIARS